VIPLPGLLGGTELVAWRLDHARHAANWDSGEGAFLFGGRWNSPGTRIVYCSIDPATAILEVAAHAGLAALDVTPRTLTSLVVDTPAAIHVVQPEDVPNSRWLLPADVSVEQQEFGDALLAEHKLVLMPSVVSSNSWNLLVSLPGAVGSYHQRQQEPFAFDPRLHGRTK
jgi:RES domain-containing protein